MHFAIRAPKCACNYMLQLYVAENACIHGRIYMFVYVRTSLVIASHKLFPRGQKDALTSLLIHATWQVLFKPDLCHIFT
jgi:hypothetical protein